MMGIIEKLMKEAEAKGVLSDAGSKYKNYTEVQNKARGMKAGGTASARADGIAVRGKTKGRIV